MGIRVGLAIMKALEKHLLGHSFESIIEHNTPEYLGAVISPTDEFIRVWFCSCALPVYTEFSVDHFHELWTDFQRETQGAEYMI